MPERIRSEFMGFGRVGEWLDWKVQKGKRWMMFHQRNVIIQIQNEIFLKSRGWVASYFEREIKGWARKIGLSVSFDPSAPGIDSKQFTSGVRKRLADTLRRDPLCDKWFGGGLRVDVEWTEVRTSDMEKAIGGKRILVWNSHFGVISSGFPFFFFFFSRGMIPEKRGVFFGGKVERRGRKRGGGW